MKKTIYLDAAASSLKPKSVIDAQMDFMENHYANSGRGMCARANYVDEMVASARQKTAGFIGAKSSEQIVFTSGTTDGLNRIVHIIKDSYKLSHSWVICISDMDHHSARMPWEELQHKNGIKIVACPLDSDFNLDFSLVDRIDVFVITAMSNVMGAPQDVKGLIASAKQINPNVITIVDAAQYVAHLPIDVSDWGCDFLCFSGHKIGADTGLGIMYIKNPDKWFPDKFGGGMIAKIQGSLATNDSHWTLSKSPDKFEAGTLPLTQIAGLSFAIDYLTEHKDNQNLIKYMHNELSKIDKIKIITSPDAFVLTFIIDDMHPIDFGALIGAYGICLRAGTMCASWLHKLMGYDGTIRISTGWWNTKDEIDTAISIIKKILKV